MLSFLGKDEKKKFPSLRILWIHIFDSYFYFQNILTVLRSKIAFNVLRVLLQNENLNAPYILRMYFF